MFDTEPADVPAGLDVWEPGPALADFLSIVDTESLSGHDRVVMLRAHQRMVSHHQAQLYRHMAAVADAYPDLEDDPALAHDAAAAEIRAALHLTRRAADTELDVAVDLAERLPRLWESLDSGRIDPRRARAILHHTAHLDPESARAVVDDVLVEAPRLTTGQLAARIRRRCIEANPDESARRHGEAVGRRTVVLEAGEDNTATLTASGLPPDRAAAALCRIDRLARSLHTAGETRGIDQLRADVFLDLLCGNGRPAGRGVVDVRVDLTTLAELDDHPAELAGYGPVIADIARQTADRQSDAEWRYTITLPDTGEPIGGGIIRRRPTRSQRREVEGRHQTCVFPGCRMPATACDLDHRIPHAQGGPTRISNLVPLCRHDHRIRHLTGWAHQRATTGDHHWTSPLGHTHTTSGTPP